MIYFYEGIPGSGKSLDIARTVCDALRNGKNVISNLCIDTEKIKPKKGKELGHFIFVSDNDWLNNSFYKYSKDGRRMGADDSMGYSYIKGLEWFSKNFHKFKSDGTVYEHQTLLVLDECHKIFNPRSWNRKDRLAWIDFFSEHRHMGYDCILSSQQDKKVDKQIAGLFQTRVFHKDMRVYGIKGFILAMLFGGHLFVRVESVYNSDKRKDVYLGAHYTPAFKYKKYYCLYKSTCHDYVATE